MNFSFSAEWGDCFEFKRTLHELLLFILKFIIFQREGNFTFQTTPGTIMKIRLLKTTPVSYTWPRFTVMSKTGP